MAGLSDTAPVVDVTDSRALNALLQLAPDSIVHRLEIRAVWRSCKGDMKSGVSRVSNLSISYRLLTSTVSGQC